MIETIIYTVTTGENYKYGVFSLINSIRQLGINNQIVVGTDRYLHELDNIQNVSQYIFDVDWNGTNLKALLILKHKQHRFIYFDADIIVTDKGFIPAVEQLLDANKLVVPIDGIVSNNEFRRIYWASIYPHTNNIVEHHWYYNAGFFAGVTGIHQQLLLDWVELNQKHLDLKAFLFDHNNLPMADQDTFNAILQTLPLTDLVTIQMPDWRAINIDHHPFYHIGNFRPHAFLHCTGKSKPWNIKSIPARSPNAYDDLWYSYLFKFTGPVTSSLKLSWWQKQWFERTLLSRIIIKLKKFIH